MFPEPTVFELVELPVFRMTLPDSPASLVPEDKDTAPEDPPTAWPVCTSTRPPRAPFVTP